MQHRSWRVRIEDILEAMAKIAGYVAEMDYAAFSSDGRTVDAVTRNLEIIGEAASDLSSDVLVRFPEVPWGRKRGLRNVLVHQYCGVNLRTIWETIQEDLPPLRPLLERVLETAE